MRPTLRELRALSFSALIGCASAAPPQAPAPQAKRDTAKPETSDAPQLAGPGEHAYTEAFFPGTTYDSGISTPDAVLGFPEGERPAHHEQVLACWRRWAQESKRVQLGTDAHTYEGRELVYGVVASEATSPSSTRSSRRSPSSPIRASSPQANRTD
jgi:hypothetical protein